MIVVSDTTAITSLLSIDRVELLQQVFGEVLVPPAVIRELLVVHPELPKFLRSIEVRNQNAVKQLTSEDLGRRGKQRPSFWLKSLALIFF